MPLPKSTEAGFPATFSTASRLSGEEGRKFVKITESTNNTSQLNSLSKRQNLPSGSSNQSKFAALLEAFGKKNQPKATTEVKDMTSPLTARGLSRYGPSGTPAQAAPVQVRRGQE